MASSYPIGQSRHALMIPMFIYLAWTWYLLTTSPGNKQIKATVLSSLDYCNSLLSGHNVSPLTFYCIFSRQQPKSSSQLELYHVFLCLKPSNVSSSQYDKSQRFFNSIQKKRKNSPKSSDPFFASLTSLSTFLPLLCPCHSTYHLLLCDILNSVILFSVYSLLVENRLCWGGDLWLFCSLLCPLLPRTQ